jgi:hypothetical protein
MPLKNHSSSQVEEKPIDGPGTGILSSAELEDYQNTADALAKQLNVSKVHVVVQVVPENLERKVCYLKEPNYVTKIRVMDKATSLGVYTAAEELREISVIKESSDAITYSESPESDDFKLGIVDYCLGMVSRLQNQFKKK